MLASATHRQNYLGQIYLDPVLMLRLLADEVGTDERQDLAIAGFFNDGECRKAWRTHFDQLFAGRSRTRHHVRKMLQQMAATSKSKELTDAILPFLGETRTETPTATGAAVSKPSVPASLVATSIEVLLTKDQRGTLVLGNRIDIIGTFTITTQTDRIQQTRTVADDLELTAIDRLKVADSGDAKTAEKPTLITVHCTLQQAADLHSYAKKGPLHVVLRSKATPQPQPAPTPAPPVWVPTIPINQGKTKTGADSGMLKRQAERQQIQLAETLQREKEFFAGTWIVESATMGKEKFPGNSMKYVFTRDGKLEMMLDSKTAAHGSTSDRTYELDLSRTPKVITFSAKSVSGEPVSQSANYEIKDGKIYLTVEKIPEQSKAAGAAKGPLSVEAKNGLVMVQAREKK